MNRTTTNLFDSQTLVNSGSQGQANPMKNYNVTDIKNLIDSAKTTLIAVPQLSVDSIGAALALAIALKKKGIEAKVYSPQKPDNNYSKLSGLELVNDTFSASDLVVSLNYPLDQIDAVSYNDDGGRLNLVVKTKANSPKIETNQISIANDSGVADVCFMLGQETSLPNAADLTAKGNWVFISPQNAAKTWAKATLVDPDAPFSEIFTFLLPMLGLNLDMDSGKDLLIGLRVATQSFSVNVSPETFEAGAICLRATQPEDEQDLAQPTEVTPIENVESSSGINSSSNKPNPTPTV